MRYSIGAQAAGMNLGFHQRDIAIRKFSWNTACALFCRINAENLRLIGLKCQIPLWGDTLHDGFVRNLTKQGT
jgi:hypothetical protein